MLILLYRNETLKIPTKSYSHLIKRGNPVLFF
jgi:hypothetical protein